MAHWDVYGNVVVVKFGKKEKLADKKKFALKFLKENKNVSTVLEKAGKFSGRLRTQKTRWIAGEKTKEALYRENACSFRFNLDTCYFSPRLASERKELAEMVKRKEDVLVLFGGVAPFAIVIAKARKKSKLKQGKIVSLELGRDCSKYARENVKRNKVDVQIMQGNAKKVESKYDRIIMARPNLEDSFLDSAFKAIRKNGIIHYYGFYDEVEVIAGLLTELIEKEAKKARKKVKIISIKKAGEIGNRKFRYRADVKVS